MRHPFGVFPSAHIFKAIGGLQVIILHEFNHIPIESYSVRNNLLEE